MEKLIVCLLIFIVFSPLLLRIYLSYKLEKNKFRNALVVVKLNADVLANYGKVNLPALKKIQEVVNKTLEKKNE